MDRNAIFLNRIYQNARMASQSGEILSAKAEDSSLAQELRRETGDWEAYAQKARELLAAYQQAPEEPPPLAQAAAWSGLQMTTLLDHSSGHLSQRMAQGLEAGAQDLQNSLREFYGCDPPVTDLARRLMEDQQTSAQQLARWGEGGIVS